ncbi:TIR domain-containing protein [Thalassobacillus devorans]|uniref:TIR domain-containing protein n=1 Tax=Thalassobacillus devorans TaxID=279813 RepID=UPI000A1CA3E9|nr:TIR domain-containing protein [Thalassobacillus devorans]
MAMKFNESELKALAKNNQGLFENSSQILKSASATFDINKTYDIFISHSFRDAEVIHGLKLFIENIYSLSVYVDWIDDPELDRTKVSKHTANRLRSRMNNCKTMLVAHSESSPDSKWVPWEVGYFDSKNGRIAVIPITQSTSYSEVFEGQEYLGLYLYGVHGKAKESQETRIWIQDNPNKYIDLSQWIKGEEPYERSA